ncbi:MAG TPA: NUDIX domain-containing protein [Xanthobacteraceae bacterium]|jgi:predicted NUDIX family NTP pyrophosphohydrolase
MPRSREISAGLLVYRRKPALQVLLAHPGGPYWVKKDLGVWTIPKGLIEAGDDLLTTARREFTEETGLAVTGEFIALEPVRQTSGKLVHAFAIEAHPDLDAFKSNEFQLEWPPKSGKRQHFPEVDRIAWFAIAEAEKKILAYQRPLLRELAEWVKRD